jgi:hypothetical protein
VILHCAAAAAARRFGPELAWYVPLGLKAWFTSRGITNVTELDWWQEVTRPGSKVRGWMQAVLQAWRIVHLLG